LPKMKGHELSGLPCPRFRFFNERRNKVITGGTIAYEDGRKADTEYTPARKARVELRFDLAEGLDEAAGHAAISAVQAECVARVQALLANQAKMETLVPPESAAQKRPAGRPKKIEPAFPPATKDEIAEAIFGSRDPMAGVQTIPPPKAIPSLSDSEPFDVVVKQPEPPNPVSDRELHSACQFKLQKLGNPVPIRELIARFCVGGPVKVDAIVQAKRREFLSELEKLC
ncbi:MAG: hypothetical protein KGJ13_12085, partial [Patescibacteria group bacterium]|nr:hypothetical protein [Patescibacteria group bacterium]